MGIIEIDNNESLKECPYFSSPCITLCPAYVKPLNDCLFHLALTDVEAVFRETARYLDKHFKMPEGEGAKMLDNLDEILSDTPADVAIATQLWQVLVSGGVVKRITTLKKEDISKIMSSAEKAITFTLKNVFLSEDDSGDDDEEYC